MATKTIVTPKGTARWPKLTTPDTKFNADGVYTVGLILEGADADGLIKTITAVRDEGYKEMCIKEKKKSLKMFDLPFKAETDSEGNETGRTVFTFKLKAKGKTKDGGTYDRKVAVFDSKGKPTTAEVWGGSDIKVAFEPRVWFAAVHGVGLSLQLKAVQVINLVTKGQGDSKSYGFSEEDGYVAEAETPAAAEPPAPAAVDGAGDGDF